MKQHHRWAIRAIITAAAVILAVSVINLTLITKKFTTDNWPETTTALDFYKLEEDTVDVLFLGSSHVVSAFLPQELYDNYGITSYNLGTEQQNLVVSYFWLKEALQTQSPQVVILDSYIMFEYMNTEPLNSEEAATRMALDFMRMGPVKLEAIRTICSLDENQTVLSYYLTNIRYHTRWTDLGEEDFLFAEYYGIPGLMGYSTNFRASGSDEYEPFVSDSSAGLTAMNSLMEEYLIKIVELCAEHNIELILVSTPAVGQDSGRHNTLELFSEQYDLLYYDFNEVTWYNAIGFDYANDMADYGHLAMSGAIKMTDFFGDLFLNSLGMESHQSDAWEESRIAYEKLMTDFALSSVTDLNEYLTILNDNKERLTILIAVREDAADSLDEDAMELLQELGLSEEWESAYRCSYYAVIDSGKVLLEDLSEDRLEHNGSFLNGRREYSIISEGALTGDFCSCSISIEGTSYAIDSRGLNIVVYDNERSWVLDSVCFDTGEAGCAATR